MWNVHAEVWVCAHACVCICTRVCVRVRARARACMRVKITIATNIWPLTLSSHFKGAGVGPTIQIGEQTVITVDAKAAGKGKVTCSVCTPEGAELDVDVVENEDGTFDIFYTAPQPGEYIICVRFGGEHIPNSPFQVTVSYGQSLTLISMGSGAEQSRSFTAMPFPVLSGSTFKYHLKFTKKRVFDN